MNLALVFSLCLFLNTLCLHVRCCCILSFQFYRIQVLVCGGSYFCWTHWGRVGEDGQNATQGCGSNVAAAIDAFGKKFKDSQ